jgi:hypothetical protein
MLYKTPSTDKTFVIGINNNKINFKEDTGSGLGAELTATLDSGTYSIAGLEAKLKEELEVAGAGTYTATYSRVTKKFTISATGVTSFQLLFNTGTNKSASILDMLGFSTVADMTAGLTVTSDVAINNILITADNGSLDFSEDAGTEIKATITAGTYTLRTLATEIETQMNAGGTYTYAVTYDEDTRKITITQTGGTSLELKWATGTNTATTIGHILGFAIGADDTSVTAYTADYEINLYTTFVFSDSDDQDSYTVEYFQPDIAQYFVYTGLKASNLSFSVNAENTEVNLTISFLGKDGEASSTPYFTNIEEITDYSQWLVTESSIKEGGTAYTSTVTNADLSLGYSLDGNSYTVGDGGGRGEIPETMFEFNGTLTGLFKDRRIIDKADAGTPSSLEVTYESQKKLSYDDPEKVIIFFPSVKFNRNYPVLEGPNGVTTTFNFELFYNSTELTSSRITIKNSRMHKLL